MHPLPVPSTWRETLEAVVHYATLAPSSHNSQPWKFSAFENTVCVYIDDSRWLRVADPDERELHISVGCAVENLMLAATHFGCSPALTWFPDELKPFLAAAIRLHPPMATEGTPAIIDAIVRRQTNHRLFHARPLAKALPQRLQECCREDGIQLFLTAGGASRRAGGCNTIRQP